jgi:hypothetical protein
MNSGSLPFLLNAIVISILAVGIEATAHADVVVADFNDLSTGTIVGQAGGTGWNGTWGDAGEVLVRGGNLTAPASTNYGISQSGSARSVWTQSDSTAFQSTREIATPLADTVWFSFLYNQPQSYSGGGISFNQSGDNPIFPRLSIEPNIGSNPSRLRLDLVTTSILENEIVVGQDTLILGRLVINPGAGAEVMDVWVNPDVSGGAGSFVLGDGDVSLSENVPIFDGGLSRLGVFSVSFTPNPTRPSEGGIIDSLRLSDRDSAFQDVTGVPEPSSVAILVIGGSYLFLRRRRNSIL